VRIISWTSLVLVSVFLTKPAFADGLDALSEAAKVASEKGNHAGAVASLRRARDSVLAEGNEEGLVRDLRAAETRWLTGLAERAEKLPLSERPPILLALLREAERVKSTDGKAAIKAAIDRTATQLWARDAGVDDAEAMALVQRLRNSFSNGEATLTEFEKRVSLREEAIRKLLRDANLPGAQGEYLKQRLAYALYLAKTPASDPFPITPSVQITSIPSDEFGSSVKKLLEDGFGTTGTKMSFATLKSTPATTTARSSRSFMYQEPYTYTVEERVVRYETVTEQVGTTSPTCFPTYASGGFYPSERDGQRVVVRSMYQTGQNCYGGGQGIYAERQVATVDYVPKERKSTRPAVETVNVETRSLVYSYEAEATIAIPGKEFVIKFQGSVKDSEESFNAPLSKNAKSFDPKFESRLRERAAAAVREQILHLVKGAIRDNKAEEIRAKLPTSTDAERPAMLTELALLEVVPQEDTVAHVTGTTKQSRVLLAAALADKRMKVEPSFLAASQDQTKIWLQLPPVDPDAEREAFVDEEREYYRRNGPGTSGSVYLGAGSTQLPGGPSFPYFNLHVGINTTPSWLMYRAFTGSAFIEVNGGLGYIFPVNGVAGVSLGARLGPFVLSGVGVGGADVVYVNRDEDVAKSPNEPEVMPAPLLGYGARLQFKTDTIRAQLAVRKHHRFLQGPKQGYVGDLRIGYGGFYVGARYETYREIFSSNPEVQPWSFIGSIGLQYDLNQTSVGELGVRK
jgi:hypothetical protein